jgi:regulator of protease activity HflC (stomatin/prohibitin superfamily)
MLLILIGIISVFLGYRLSAGSFPASRWGFPLKIFGAIAGIVGFGLSSVIAIQPGEVGIKILFGQVQEGTLPSGLHLVNPLLDIERFDIRTQNYTMSSVHDEGEQQGDDAIRVLTADGLEVIIDLTVLYRVLPDRTPEILKKIGTQYKSVVVRPITRTKIRDNAVYYDAVSLYSTKRDEFQNRIFNDISKLFKSRGLELEQLLVRNITLPNSVKQTIESKINAEQESQKMQFVLSKEKQEAERKRVEAQGIADYQKIVSSTLSANQLQYELIKAQKEIATSPNAKIVIMGNKEVPLILNQ